MIFHSFVSLPEGMSFIYFFPAFCDPSHDVIFFEVAEFERVLQKLSRAAEQVKLHLDGDLIRGKILKWANYTCKFGVFFLNIIQHLEKQFH